MAFLYMIGGAVGAAILYFAYCGLSDKLGAKSKAKKAKAEEERIQEAIKKGPMRDPGNPDSVAQNDITGVGKNGVFRIPGFGKDLRPIETSVNRIHRYNDGGKNTWYELICYHNAMELLIEWYKQGRRLHVTAGYEEMNPELEDLGLDEDALIAFDEGQRKDFEWDGRTWKFESSGESFYYEDDGYEREGFYLWSFESSDGKEKIDIEKWEDEDEFCVYHLWEIDPEKIEVFSAGNPHRRSH